MSRLKQGTGSKPQHKRTQQWLKKGCRIALCHLPRSRRELASPSKQSLHQKTAPAAHLALDHLSLLAPGPSSASDVQVLALDLRQKCSPCNVSEAHQRYMLTPTVPARLQLDSPDIATGSGNGHGRRILRLWAVCAQKAVPGRTTCLSGA